VFIEEKNIRNKKTYKERSNEYLYPSNCAVSLEDFQGKRDCYFSSFRKAQCCWSNFIL